MSESIKETYKFDARAEALRENLLRRKALKETLFEASKETNTTTTEQVEEMI